KDFSHSIGLSSCRGAAIIAPAYRSTSCSGYDLSLCPELLVDDQTGSTPAPTLSQRHHLDGDDSAGSGSHCRRLRVRPPAGGFGCLGGRAPAAAAGGRNSPVDRSES